MTMICATAVTVRQTKFVPNFGWKVVQDIAQNIGQFSQCSHITSFKSLLTMQPKHWAVRLSLFYFTYFWSGLPAVAAVWASAPVGHARPMGRGYWLIWPATSSKLVHLATRSKRLDSWTPLI